MSVGCLVPAAGRGERLGAGEPKALRQLAGSTLLERSLRAIASAPAVTDIVIAAPAGGEDRIHQIIDHAGLNQSIQVVTGGTDRTASVRAALRLLPADCSIVLVHDAARPLVPTEMISRIINACRAGTPAVIPGIPVVDTLKYVDESGRVQSTPDRDKLRAIQTPQGFHRDVIERALAQPAARATDDAGLVESLGIPIMVVPGHTEALKITRPDDFLYAEAIIRKRRSRGVH